MVLLFTNQTEFDEEGILFYPNGDVSEKELEKMLHQAHERGYRDDKEVRCHERVRLSPPEAEVPRYGRRVVKITLGRLKEIYGRPYNPDQEFSNDFVPAFINGELYDIGS